MANFVDGLLFGNQEPAFLIQRLLFEEAMHCFSGIHEVVITTAVAVSSGENRPVLVDIKVVDDRCSSIADTADGFVRNQAFKDGKTLFCKRLRNVLLQ